MELEAACEQYRRALETNTINQDQVSKMSAKFAELHVKVSHTSLSCVTRPLVVLSVVGHKLAISQHSGLFPAFPLAGASKTHAQCSQALCHAASESHIQCSLALCSVPDHHFRLCPPVSTSIWDDPGGELGGCGRPVQAARRGVADQAQSVGWPGPCHPRHVRAGFISTLNSTLQALLILLRSRRAHRYTTTA